MIIVDYDDELTPFRIDDNKIPYDQTKK